MADFNEDRDREKAYFKINPPKVFRTSFYMDGKSLGAFKNALSSASLLLLRIE